MKRHTIALMLYLLLFGGLFVASLHNFVLQQSFFYIGLPGKSMDILILALSFFGVIKTIWHLHTH